MHAMPDYVVFVSPCSFHKLFKYLEKPTGRQALMMKQHLESSAAQWHLLIEQSFRKLRCWLPGWNAARRSEVARDLQTLHRVSTVHVLHFMHLYTCIMQHLSNAVSSRRRSPPCRRRCQRFEKHASLQCYMREPAGNISAKGQGLALENQGISCTCMGELIPLVFVTGN